METLTIPLVEIDHRRLKKAAEEAGMSIEAFMCEWIKQLPAVEGSETEIDKRVVTQAEDDAAWEDAISVQRNFDAAAIAKLIEATTETKVKTPMDATHHDQ